MVIDLSTDFVNEGKLSVSGSGKFTSRKFINHGKIYVAETISGKEEVFINDKGGNITANGPIEIVALGQDDQHRGIYQNSDSVLESKSGGIKLIAPVGGVYFGYEKKLNGGGDNHDGFDFIGSKLISSGGPIHIQSGLDAIFDGAQILGNIAVESKGEIKETIPQGKYKNGAHDVVQKEAKTRIVMKPEKKTRIVNDVKTRVRLCADHNGSRGYTISLHIS